MRKKLKNTHTKKMHTKKIFQFTIVLIIIYALCGSAAAIFGNGSEQNPYIIENATNLRELAEIIPNTVTGTYLYVIQTEDITLTTPGNIIPIEDTNSLNLTSKGQNNNFELLGTLDVPFYGKYDGSNYTITNLHYQEWEYNGKENSYLNNIGLFGGTNNSVIENVRLKDAKIWGHNDTGTLIGQSNNTTIQNCFIENTTVEAAQNGGGVVGNFNGGLIKNSSVTGKIIPYALSGSNSGSNAGGIAGYVNNLGTIENSYFAGTIKSTARYYSNIGGIAGRIMNGTVSNCYSVCEIEGYSALGGIVGMIRKGEIENCYSIGKVSGQSMAGILGAVDYGDPGAVITENNIALNEYINGSYSSRVVSDMYKSPMGTNYGWIGMQGKLFYTEGMGINVTSKKIWSTFPNNEWEIFDANIWKLNTYDDYRLPVFKWQTEELQENASYLRTLGNPPQVGFLDVIESDDSSITFIFEVEWNDEETTQDKWNVELFYSESADIFASDKITATFDGSKYITAIQNSDLSKEYHVWGTVTHQEDSTFINGTEYTFMLGSAPLGNTNGDGSDTEDIESRENDFGNIDGGGSGTGNATIINPAEENPKSKEAKPAERNSEPEEPKSGQLSPRQEEPKQGEQNLIMWQICLICIIIILFFVGKRMWKKNE